MLLLRFAICGAFRTQDRLARPASQRVRVFCSGLFTAQVPEQPEPEIQEGKKKLEETFGVFLLVSWPSDDGVSDM